MAASTEDGSRSRLTNDAHRATNSKIEDNQGESELTSDYGDCQSPGRAMLSHDTTDESSGATEGDDLNFVPESSGISSDASPRGTELKTAEGISTKHSGYSTTVSGEQMSSNHCARLANCSQTSEDNTSQEKSSVKVAPLPNTEKQSKPQKKQYCLYCKKAFCALSRHLIACHSKEPDVAKVLSFKKGSRERHNLLRYLKLKGNFGHNAFVARHGIGEMVTCRRSKKSRQLEDYCLCRFCHGLYSRKSLTKHMRNCPQKPAEVEINNGRKSIGLDLPRLDQVQDTIWEIACGMTDDDISVVVRQERLILSLGESLFNSRRAKGTCIDYIRQKMRQAARLLMTARAISPLKTTEDLVMPSNFPVVIKAVRAVAGYNSETNSYKTPSLALTLGHSLAKIACIVQCNAIIANQTDLAESAEQFITLYEKRWEEAISVAALGSIQQVKWNKPKVLTFTQDVLLLHKFLSSEHAKCMKDLEMDPNIQSFGNLIQVTLAQMILFNRHRQGEVSRMELQNFASRKRGQLNPDTKCLTKLERKLAQHFDTVEIRGKRSKKVPVLLTPDMTAAIELLLKKRTVCHIHKDNVFVFAKPNIIAHYRGSACLRKFAVKCGANNPQALISARLIKQVSTLSAVLNLKENEMDLLATFLGLDIRVHREFYRLPESTLQLAKVSKLLIAMEGGRLSELQGKGLDDIEIKSDDEVDMSDNDSGKEPIADSHQHQGPPAEAARKQTPLSQAPDSTTLDSTGGTTESTTQSGLDIRDTQPTHDLKNTNLQSWSSHASPRSSKRQNDVQLPIVKKEELPPEQQERSPYPDQEENESPLIKKEEEEVWMGQGREQLQGLEEADTKFLFPSVHMKSENDEEEKPESSLLHQRLTDHMETAAGGEDCGRPEPARSSHPERYSPPEIEVEIEASSDTGSGSEDEANDWEETREEGVKTKAVLVRNISEQTKGALHSCPECGKDFNQKGHLRTHMFVHTKEKPFSCSECGKNFGQKGTLTAHMLVHTKEKPFSCSECGKKFNRKRSLRTHMWVHTQEKPFGCFECGKSYNEKHTLTKHMLVHSKEKPFSCSECGKNFGHKGYLTSHMMVHTKEKPFSCSECGRNFSRKGDLTSHMLIHTNEKAFSCSECGKRFRRNAELARHMGVHSKEKAFSCSECGKIFSLKKCLTKHMLAHKKETPHSCPECGRRFWQEATLTAHMLAHEKEKPFCCSECGKLYMLEGELVRHMYVHAKEKPFGCLECGKKFWKKGKLTVHMVVHTKEKPFSCSECGKNFSQKSSLTTHMLIHTNEKPFDCIECGRKFRQKGALHAHMSIHTSAKPHCCSQCSKRYSRKADLVRHLVVHTRNTKK